MISTTEREWVRKKNRATVQRLCPLCGRRDHLKKCERRANEFIEIEETNYEGV